MSLAEYSALLQLAEAPDRRLRMNQLADGVFLSWSGVTRLIDRLETDGLVARSQCSSDGCGAEAVLTDDGLARLRAASPIHLRGIETYFLALIPPDELAVVERALGAVEERIRRDGRPLGTNGEQPAVPPGLASPELSRGRADPAGNDRLSGRRRSGQLGFVERRLAAVAPIQ